MKLPDQFLKEFQRGQGREHQAMLHLGIATAEFEQHKKRLLDQATQDRIIQNVAVQEGLQALGFNTEDEAHHYTVLIDGTVKELVAGEYVEVVR